MSTEDISPLDTLLVDQIQEIRATNNEAWMSLLRLALRHDPKGTKDILKGIIMRDEFITRRMKEMVGD